MRTLTRFRTATGSTYEVCVDDGGGTLARRLSGRGEPTPRFGPDGEWRAALRAEVGLGRSAVIVWGADEDGVGKYTRTSRVVEVEHTFSRGGSS